jgi:hypothetical protein
MHGRARATRGLGQAESVYLDSISVLRKRCDETSHLSVCPLDDVTLSSALRRIAVH